MEPVDPASLSRYLSESGPEVPPAARRVICSPCRGTGTWLSEELMDRLEAGVKGTVPEPAQPAYLRRLAARLGVPCGCCSGAGVIEG